MESKKKVCVFIRQDGHILAFSHPKAGKQFIKGTCEPNETIHQTAIREVYEESGLDIADCKLTYLGESETISQNQSWHILHCNIKNIPQTWIHYCYDDGGHEFSYFWHPETDRPEPHEWHDMFIHAYDLWSRKVIGG